MDFWTQLFNPDLARAFAPEAELAYGAPGTLGAGLPPEITTGQSAPPMGGTGQPPVPQPLPLVEPPLPGGGQSVVPMNAPPMGGPPPYGAKPVLTESFRPPGSPYRVAQEGGLPGAPPAEPPRLPTMVPRIPGAGGGPTTSVLPPAVIPGVQPTQVAQVTPSPPSPAPPAPSPGSPQPAPQQPAPTTLGQAMEPTDIRSQAQKEGETKKPETPMDRFAKMLGTLKLPAANERVVKPTTPAAPFQPQYRGLAGGDTQALQQQQLARLLAAPALRPTLGSVLGGRYLNA